MKALPREPSVQASYAPHSERGGRLTRAGRPANTTREGMEAKKTPIESIWRAECCS